MKTENRPGRVLSRRRRWLFRTILLLFLILLAEATGYVGLRVLRRRFPMDPVAEITPRRVERFLQRRYHPVYGWGPNTRMGDINRQGARSRREYGGDLRATISVYGDSYTFGLNVPVESSWPAQLEQQIHVPVMNFAVDGFGTDQALLRLEDNHDRAPSATVLMCLQVENVNRCVSVYRGFYQAGFAPPKPRFVLDESKDNTELQVLNPFDSPAAVRTYLLEQPETLWQLCETYDHWYRELEWRGRPWRICFPYSFQLALRTPYVARRLKVALTGQPLHTAMYADHEAFGVLRAIIERFLRLSDEKRFTGLVVVLPTFRDVHVCAAGGKLPYQPLLDYLDETDVPYVDVTPAMASHPNRDQLFIGGDGHYTKLGGEIVAEVVADFLREQNAFPPPPRADMKSP